jgi:hypothetical protein
MRQDASRHWFPPALGAPNPQQETQRQAHSSISDGLIGCIWVCLLCLGMLIYWAAIALVVIAVLKLAWGVVFG